MKPGKYKTTFLGTEIPVLYVTERAEAERLIARLLDQPVELTGIDTETAALEMFRRTDKAALSPHLSKVRLLQLFTGRTAIVFDCNILADDSLFTNYLERGKFVGHNSLFDLQYFYKQFKVTKCDIGCTYLITKLIYHATMPTDGGVSAGLAAVANGLLGQEIIKEMQRSDFSVPELTWEQIEYAAIDAISVYHVALKLAPKLQRFGLERIYKLYRDAQHPIAKMQLNGIRLDVDKHRDLIVTWRDELYKAKKKLAQLTGLQYLTATTLGEYLEKTLPPETLAIWPRTETGKVATDSHVFADFDYLDIVKPFTEFQKRAKLCTSFGNSLIESVNPVTGRLHASYRLAGARTGRLSCSNPNLQQLPREATVRRNFVPENGRVFVCADYSQVEIRVAAEISRDETMLKAYKEGIDLHRLTASLISKKDIKDVTKQDRQMAKAFNFGLLFGLGATKFSHYAKKSYGAEVSPAEAKRGVSTFRDTYWGYREWQVKQSGECQRRGEVRTPCGKLRKLDTDNCYGASLNTPVQGGAAEVMLHALIRLDKDLTKYIPDAKLVNCVHDEILVECAPEDAEDVHDCIVCCMVEGFKDVFPNGIVRDVVEVHEGKSWGEAKG